MGRDNLIRNVVSPLLRLRRHIQPSRRRQVRAHEHALKFRMDAFSWGEEQKRAWTIERLRTVVREAAGNTGYYGEMFRREGFDPSREFNFDDFAKLPVLERQNVLESAGRLISGTIDWRTLRTDSSGGSTGEPAKIWVGPMEDTWHTTAREFFMRKIGLPPGSRTAYFWGHHLDPLARDSLKARLVGIIGNHRWFDCFRLSPEIMARYHEEMELYQPDCIVAYASALGAYAQFLFSNGLRPSYPKKAIVTGAEKLFDSQRLIAEKVFRKPVYERYGSRDAGMMGFQLDIPDSKSFTVDWPNLMIEPETADPESAILVTKLRADAMPMIRYRVGDLGEFPADCRPGHPVFKLLSVAGRATEKIWLPSGAFINAIQFPHLFKDFPVREFMVVQEEDYSVEVKIVPEPQFTEASTAAISSTIAKNLPGLVLKVSLVDSIPRTKANKWRPVISRVTPSIGAQSSSR